MAVFGTRPTWYRRLPPALQRVAAASDRVPVAAASRRSCARRRRVTRCPLHYGASRRPRSRPSRSASPTASAARSACSPLRVRVEGQRPHDHRGELHGLYLPADGSRARPHHALDAHGEARRRWSPTAPSCARCSHELCHHLDYTYLRLRDSLAHAGILPAGVEPVRGAWAVRAVDEAGAEADRAGGCAGSTKGVERDAPA